MMAQKKKRSSLFFPSPGRLLFLPFRTIFAVAMLNFCVRYGYRCSHCPVSTRLLFNHSKLNNASLLHLTSLGSSPRPISLLPLHASLHFHSVPIYLLVSKGPYISLSGSLILKGISRLDAFSVYCFRT